MVSFDIESLFTNVPVEETINIISSLAYDETKSDLFVSNLNKGQLTELLRVCTKKSHFLFNRVVYDQVDGVAMGSPLGPIFANAFMDNFEKCHMQKLRELGVVHWYRYMDDTFVILNKKDDLNGVLDLNNQHQCIKFTYECENNNSIAFLDVLVTRQKGVGYLSSVYHKPTFSGS